MLRRPLATGFAFAMALSLGDLGVIALFGSDSVQTLPYLLLARMGSYRTDDAAGLALLLGLLCLALVFLADRFGKERLLERRSDRRRAVRLDECRFSYGEAAMRFDVDVQAGAITAVMGPSGSGKSTLLNLVAGFETPASGRVLIGGEDVTALPPAARPVSMVFQENNLFAHLDVGKNVGLGRSPSLRLTAADQASRRRSAGAHRPCRQGAAPAARTLRRRAPARGARPRPGSQPPGAAARRAVRARSARPCATTCSTCSPACRPSGA